MCELLCYLQEDEFFFWWREAAGLSPALLHPTSTATTSLEALHVKDPIAQKQRKQERLTVPENPLTIDKSQAHTLCLLLLQRGVYMFKKMIHDVQFLKKKKATADGEEAVADDNSSDTSSDQHRKSKWTQIQINHLVETYLPQLLPGTFEETVSANSTHNTRTQHTHSDL
jgi:hypothetical protein